MEDVLARAQIIVVEDAQVDVTQDAVEDVMSHVEEIVLTHVGSQIVVLDAVELVNVLALLVALEDVNLVVINPVVALALEDVPIIVILIAIQDVQDVLLHVRANVIRIAQMSVLKTAVPIVQEPL